MILGLTSPSGQKEPSCFVTGAAGDPQKPDSLAGGAALPSWVKSHLSRCMRRWGRRITFHPQETVPFRTLRPTDRVLI
jgi:hypothetical protein